MVCMVWILSEFTGETNMNYYETLVSTLKIKLYRRLLYISSIIYLLFYLIAIQNIALTSQENFNYIIVSNPLETTFNSQSFLQYEAIMQVVLPPIIVAISPINILIGLILSLLVGLNISLVYRLYKQPNQCKIRDSTGIISILPPLLSGAACCAPAIVLILGLQVTATMMTIFSIMLPISFVLLVLSIIYLLDKVN